MASGAQPHLDGVLCTDIDILFTADVPPLRMPRVVGAAVDQIGYGINGGVLLYNVTGFTEWWSALQAAAQAARFEFGAGMDQAMLSRFALRNPGFVIDRLPATMNMRAKLPCVGEPSQTTRRPSCDYANGTDTPTPSFNFGGMFIEPERPACAAGIIWHFQGEPKLPAVPCILGRLQTRRSADHNLSLCHIPRAAIVCDKCFMVKLASLFDLNEHIWHR